MTSEIWPILGLSLLLGLSAYFSIPTDTTAKLIERTQEKVVKIGVVPEKGRWIGSGSIISPDGLILTCAHLFGPPAKVFVKTASGQTYLARIVRVDHNVDLAVLKIDALSPLPYFKLGRRPYIGQKVLAFGSPLDIQGTVTQGYVENINAGPRLVTIQGCPTNPGNSGGPLVDEAGRLVGVNVAVLLLNPFQIAQGMSVTVSMDTIRMFVRL